MYVLIRENNNWMDYIETTDYKIIAVSPNRECLEHYKTSIVDKEYKEDMDQFNEVEDSFIYDDYSISFKIVETKGVFPK